MSKIKKVISREILDSRGNPTIEAEVHLTNGMIGIASTPSGASTGKYEALELRDHDKSRFLGLGVKNAVSLINEKISHALNQQDVIDQNNIDTIMIDLDGTDNKSILGANSILAVSLATAKVAAQLKNIPLYQHLSDLYGTPGVFSMPLPMVNIINGGKHANNNIDIQEFMIQPIKANNIKEAIQISSEIFHHLSKILKHKNLSIAVGDEGGYAPNLKSNEEALIVIAEAIHSAKYILGKDVTIAIDCAASELYDNNTKKYYLSGDNTYYSSEEFTKYLKKLANQYHIVSIEDGQDQSDWQGFAYQTEQLGKHIQLVGDDLFVTNTKILEKGIKNNIANSILIKPNQIGTLSETLNAIRMAKKAKYTVIISHRSGETEDTFISDLAVGTASGQIKTGSMSRTDRLAKYNQLIRIEESLGNITAPFNGIKELYNS